MGVSGLLPLLRSVTTEVSLDKYRGCKAGIDAHGWMHKAGHFCAKGLLNSPPDLSALRKLSEWILRRIKMVQHYGITPVLVFDGARLPMKQTKEASRQMSREQSLKKAREIESSVGSQAAFQYYSKALDITPFMVWFVIQELKKEDIDYLVAPYEADAQLAYLEKIGEIDFVVTEDSDFLVYGCKHVLFKLDNGGNVQEIKLTEHMKEVDAVNFSGWSFEMFQMMCILSGCDYLEGIPGLGIKKSYRLVGECKTFDRVMRRLKFDFSVSQDYQDRFAKALLTFRHHTVFDRKSQKLTNLSPITEEELVQVNLESSTSLAFLGEDIDSNVLNEIVSGDFDPISKIPLGFSGNGFIEPQDQVVKQESLRQISVRSSNHISEALAKQGKLS